MNIIEAIKSGKLHKRKINREWCHASSVTNQFSLAYSIDDILANDWEVEQVPVTVTEDSFAAAWKRAVRKAGGDDLTYGGFQSFRDLVARELGL